MIILKKILAFLNLRGILLFSSRQIDDEYPEVDLVIKDYRDYPEVLSWLP